MRSLFAVLLATGTFLPTNFSFVVASELHPREKSDQLEREIYFCLPGFDQNVERSSSLNSCFSTSIQSTVFWKSGADKVQPAISADSSGQWEITPQLAVVAMGRFSGTTENQLNSHQSPRIRKVPEVLGVRVGEPEDPSGNVFFAGRGPLPFGIQHRILEPELADSGSEKFWASRPLTASLTQQMGTHWSMQLGGGAKDYSGKIDLWAGRAFYDFSALDGSRLVMSIIVPGSPRLETIIASKRLGLGLINRNDAGDDTSIEYVLAAESLESQTRKSQLIRIVHSSKWRKKSRWVVEFEDELHEQRMLQLVNEHAILEKTYFRITLLYVNRRQASGNLGIGAGGKVQL